MLNPTERRPEIGDDVVVMDGLGKAVFTSITGCVQDEGKEFHLDRKGNSYFTVQVAAGSEPAHYNVRWDELLEAWTQVGLTMDYEED